MKRDTHASTQQELNVCSFQFNRSLCSLSTDSFPIKTSTSNIDTAPLSPSLQHSEYSSPAFEQYRPMVQPLRKSRMGPQDMRHRVTMGTGNLAPRGIPKRHKVRCWHRNLYRSVHSSVIHKNWEGTVSQMSVHSGTDKQTMVDPYDGLLLGREKDLCHNTDELWKIVLS